MISIHKPGFAWLARMQAMPLLSARVLDCYVDGEGLLEARRDLGLDGDKNLI